MVEFHAVTLSAKTSICYSHYSATTLCTNTTEDILLAEKECRAGTVGQYLVSP